MGPIFAVWGAAIATAWIFWAIFSNARRAKIAEAQAQVRTRILDKIGTGQEMVEFMKTEGGRQLLKELPVDSARQTATDRIQRAVQAGLIFLVLGGGFVIINGYVSDRNENLFVGILFLSLGLGFLLAGGATYLLSKGWGLLDKKDGHA